MVRVDFVVYTAPNGKKDKQYIELTDELLSPMDQPAFEKKVKALQKAGYEFSAEILSTGKINFHDGGMAQASAEWTRPSGNEDTDNNDLMIIYFTSGTTSMPKIGRAQFYLPTGSYRYGKILAACHRWRTSPYSCRFGLGQIRVGEALWPMDMRCGPVCL